MGFLGGCRVGLGCGQNAAQGMLAPPSGFDPQLKTGGRLPSSFLGQDVPDFLPSSFFASCPKHRALGEQQIPGRIFNNLWGAAQTTNFGVQPG